ncbi:MAE_28990/MAE_18760 family HEPN-like nuclease [Saprospira grandis]|nr:MAE_28990/MAE_18760 family HEPN-like nuclease [Saprospira grandis]WBM76282.1 MAE_28990/MAE_18760 family HEPN-like nuclease [Saprospira grandis]
MNTNSNLGFKVMNDRLILFGIEKFSKVHKGLSGARHFLERDLKSLLDSRNRIAHGVEVLTASKIDQKDYNDYKLLLGDLMAEIIERMLVALNNKTYLKS